MTLKGMKIAYIHNSHVGNEHIILMSSSKHG